MAIIKAFMVPHPPMIVPDIGRGGEKEIEETIKAYEQVADEIAEIKPETIIITSPHSIMYADYFHISPGAKAKGNFARFNAASVKFEENYDEELVNAICDLAYRDDFSAGTLGEKDKSLDHGTMVPLYFIRNKYKAGKIVRIGLSGLPLTDHYKFGMMINEAVTKLGRRTVFVASGDLSHKLQSYGPYGFAEEGPLYDERIMDVAKRAAFSEMLDFDEVFCDKAAECGHRSFVIMAGALDGMDVEANYLSHQDVTGVGYGICTFKPIGLNEKRHFLKQHLSALREKIENAREQSDPYVKLARRSLESFIVNGKVIKAPLDLPLEMLQDRAGVFVSIHKHGKLRGCIGTTGPTEICIADEIIQNAISASTKDPRFDPITEDELEWLEINVDVLTEPEPISSIDELDVKKYGVIVSCGGRRGLLLPDLDGVDTVEDQVQIAMDKGRIRRGESVSLQRFEVIRHV
ncbi:MAG: AmmeMemoRadiSam system protein A [Lachnospiraceae bacterium]|nr:AmmeMemoRadiSam system protein A [Lachnospiraceae bacterium]